MKMILLYIALSLGASHTLGVYQVQDIMADMGVEEETIASISATTDKLMRFDLTAISDMIGAIDVSYLRGLVPNEKKMSNIGETVSNKMIEIYKMIIDETPTSNGGVNVLAPQKKA